MAATAASDVSDGPVLSLINKRLRALRKKNNRILQMEEFIAQGKPINKEQEEVLRTKPSVVAAIDELEKLRQPLSSAVEEEINLAIQRHQVSTAETTTVESKDEETDSSKSNIENQEIREDSVIEDLLNLLYFGSMFDVKSQNDFTATMLTRTHERGCCLTYDYVTDDDTTDLLGERDLDLISLLGGLLISRPVDSSFSHSNALQQCIKHAKLWLAKSDQPIESNPNVTYADLREKLKKIMASDYFTTTPEMKAPVEMAAASGNYGSFHVPVQVEASAVHYQQKEEDSTNSQENEAYDHESIFVEELPKGESEVENHAEFLAQTEPSKTQAEEGQNLRDVESKEHNEHYVSQRIYQNHRGGRGGGGGGRRGYPNGRGGRNSGRGGGHYQNGRNQYYDQPGNYFPRNYYYNNRGRGGRGGGGGNYNHHGSAGEAGYAPAQS